MFSMNLLLQVLQNLWGVILVNLLAWGNKFVINYALTVKKDHQHALNVCPDLPSFLHMWTGWAFVLRGLLFSSYIVTVNPGFVSCASYAVFLTLK
jgi:hypothetical protein